MSTVSVAAVSGLSGIIAGALGAGIWIGSIATEVRDLDRRVNIDFDRRLIAHAARLEALEGGTIALRISLVEIKTKLDSIAFAVVPRDDRERNRGQ